MVNWKKWFFEIGPKFMKKMGIEKNHVIFEFGAKNGDYTIAAAVFLDEKMGKIIAYDKDKQELNDLNKRAQKYNVKNIKIIQDEWVKKLPIEDKSVDIVLIFDVLHYFDHDKRMDLYNEIFRILKNEGFFITFPQHCSESYPLWNFSDLSIKDIIYEIEQNKFTFVEQFSEKLIHDHDWWSDGIILKFKK